MTAVAAGPFADPLPDPFPDWFTELLREIVRRVPHLRGGRDPRHRSKRKLRGTGGLFAGHRPYSLGDDLRLMDWNVYARTGDLFLKVLEEEERRSLTLVFDVSASMTAGGRWTGALRLCAVLGSLALAHLDGLHLVDGRSPTLDLEGAASRGRLLSWLRERVAGEALPGHRLLAALGGGAGGKVVWVSDFAAPDEAGPVLLLLRRRGLPCTGWLPAVAEDRAVAVHGLVRVLDPESGREQVLQVDSALRRALAEELARLARHQDAVFRGAGVPLVRFPLPDDEDRALAGWLEAGWSSRS